MRDAPSPDAPPPARRGGASDAGAVPRVETVRVTAPDLARRAALERTRSRLVIAAGGFALLFGAVAAKLTDATVIFPLQPRRAANPIALVEARLAEAKAEQARDAADGGAGDVDAGAPKPMRDSRMEAAAAHGRAQIVDRNGAILAISLPTAAVYANPKEMIDTAEAAHKLHQVLPRLNEDAARSRLATASKQFVYLARQVTPREQVAINSLGIPGIYFEPSEQRRYPQGRVAAQVLGAVDVDGHGVAGVERAFEDRLEHDPSPLRLSIDVRVQGVMREELSKAMAEFSAIGACGIVMDVRTGEVLAMVSLPDYDANLFGHATPEQRFNRAVTGMYEPGSTFKLQTAAMALDYGAAQIWSVFDAAHDIKIGRFTISDFQGKHRPLVLPEVIAYSSNLGAAHIAQTVGSERQRAWMQKMGMFERIGIELPEQGRPIVPSVANWKEVVTMTVGFGHGIAVSPLHVVRGTAAIANGGLVLRPTILAVESGAQVDGARVMQQATSDTLRKLMRLVVTEGYGKPAEVPGYYVGGKTGTAEKASAHGYKKHTNISAFMSVFPMNAPRYAVYFMLDEPHGTKETGGFSTAGAVSAPGAGRVIARIGPMLGLFPDTEHAAQINQALYIPLQPGHGSAGRPMAAAPAMPAAHPAAAPAPRPSPAPGREASLHPALAGSRTNDE